MTEQRTAYDAEMEKAKMRLAAKQTAADSLAKRARLAAREARKAALLLEGTDRKRRDRAKYILGGITMARLQRQGPADIITWLDRAALTDKDRALVKAVLSSVMSEQVVEQNVGPLSITAAPDVLASMAAYPSPGSATNKEHGDG